MTNDGVHPLKSLSSRSWWLRFIVFFAVFIAFTGLGVEEIAFGATAAAIASAISSRLDSLKMDQFSLRGLVYFIPYFVSISVRGGIDVAWRAFSPSMPLAPGFVEYELRVQPGEAAAVFFAAVISLIPGTLCVEFGSTDKVVVHVVDLRSDFEAELKRLERRSAAVFGEALSPRERGGR